MFAQMRIVFGLLLLSSFAVADETHEHGVPEKLGSVSLPISCQASVQQPFNRAVALLHSFAYAPAQQAFQAVAKADPSCAMAYWGLAMVHFHAVWTPALPPDAFAQAQRDAAKAVQLGGKTGRERGFIEAAGVLFQAGDRLTPHDRTVAYEQAMGRVAHAYPDDVEAQVFYAVAMLSNADLADKTHAKQKQAIAILQPLFRAHPDHPGLAHYLIHASDSAELAAQGLPAARVYARIAPSASHALHMPSHIFTRLGLWDDSIQSNLASKQSAHAQGDAMGELHAMDYLVYAYLQEGRDTQAASMLTELQAMPSLDMHDFAIAYATTVMPIRAAVERGRWADAARIEPPASAPPAVVAIAVWAKGLGLARTGQAEAARAQAAQLRQIQTQLHDHGDDYWAVQTSVLADEVMAWSSHAAGDDAQAETLLRAAADREDAVEKRPVTPGPVLPAREQLGELYLLENKFEPAAEAYRQALLQASGRRGALIGEARSRKTNQ